MVKITIDNKTYEVKDNITILDAAKDAGIIIPTLCYLRNINEIGACRVCLVEVEGADALVTACNNKVYDGMVIKTNTPRVRKARKTNVELILSQHDSRCPTCVRNQNCSLQTLAGNLGLVGMPFKTELERLKPKSSFPLIRKESKCIKCMRCVQVCDKIQSMKIWDVLNTGSYTTVGVTGGGRLENSDCTLCGQCITHCPVGALRARDDTQKAFEALSDNKKITVVQVAPAVRSAWGEAMGLTNEQATVKKMVAAIRKIGFNYVFDTDFTADLTIMEEASELLEMLKSPEKHHFPLFTSCCPGWVRFMKSQYLDMLGQLSTAKSPQQMFGAVAKSYYANILGTDPKNIYCISLMPCVAKKYECSIPVMNDACGEPDVDLVLTTREFDRMLKEEHIDVLNLPDEDFDNPLGTGTGAGVIFGATGGVMEAALRTAYYFVTGKNPEADAFKDVRGLDGWKEASFEIAGQKLKVAIASGLGNARKLMEALKNGEVFYHFVEIMACPGGCAGGGGQPIKDGVELAEIRGKNLYDLDEAATYRFSHENPEVLKLYKDFIGNPLSEKAHKLLHTEHTV